ncbi:hypothetical protein AB0L41_32165 [Amycolatopsis mediterranei]|uniref:hypothetical protein n=1 Tax=Amycolatopsis mediterranei TaxID=33910 RepID=UPI0034299C1E
MQRVRHDVGTVVTRAARGRTPRRTHDAALGWLDGARSRARALLEQGQPIDQVAEAAGLESAEVEDIYVAMLTEHG